MKIKGFFDTLEAELGLPITLLPMFIVSWTSLGGFVGYAQVLLAAAIDLAIYYGILYAIVHFTRKNKERMQQAMSTKKVTDAEMDEYVRRRAEADLADEDKATDEELTE